nr:family 20 glycosylhydrolase [Clostridia bacterium]
MLKLKFIAASELMCGIKRLAPVLGYEITDGIADLTVTAVQASDTSVKINGTSAVITYAKKHLFFRELGAAIEHASEDGYSFTEDKQFKTVSVMIDASRCAVPTVDGVCRLFDYLAVMGYNMAMMYTEDTVEIKERPYFGYMRGRYTKEEMIAIDDYAYEYGIEVIPCLECYGHMEKYLIWGEAYAIKDTNSVMLAREEETFKFLDQYIGTVAQCFRSNRIHIGMDEAWDMGRGRFLTKHGYVPPFEIFNEYMERLIGITNKYNLKPMMWSDMYFRVCTDNNGYYGEDIVIPEEVSSKIPKEVELVFWHYGEKPYCDDYMLKKHAALN